MVDLKPDLTYTNRLQDCFSAIRSHQQAQPQVELQPNFMRHRTRWPISSIKVRALLQVGHSTSIAETHLVANWIPKQTLKQEQLWPTRVATLSLQRHRTLAMTQKLIESSSKKCLKLIKVLKSSHIAQTLDILAELLPTSKVRVPIPVWAIKVPIVIKRRWAIIRIQEPCLRRKI